jgi:sulfocyanin
VVTSDRTASSVSSGPDSSRPDTAARATAAHAVAPGDSPPTSAGGPDSAARDPRQRLAHGGSPPAAGVTGSAPAKRIGRPADAPSTPSTPSTPSGSPGGQDASTAPATTSAAQEGTSSNAADHGPGDTKVNKFLSYNAGKKTVSIKLYAAYNSAQGGFNFNGGSSGNQTITVPANWMVTIDVTNVDAIPHSAIIIADQMPIPNAPSTPAIPRAYTNHLTDGLPPQNGHDTMSFRASPAGNYLIACGVPGHAPSGMYIKFVISATATAPTNTGVVPST